MTRRISFILIISLLTFAFIATSAMAKSSDPLAPKKKQPYNPRTRVGAMKYVLPYGQDVARGTVKPSDGVRPQASLGVSVPSTSPGQILGDTYYDYQANNFQGRMVRSGRHFDNGINDSVTLVHFVWMNTPVPPLDAGHRGPSYAYFEAAASAYQPELEITFDPQRSGYFNLEVSNANQAIICGHYNAFGNVDEFAPQVWYDNAAGDQGFGYIAPVPLVLTEWENPYTGDAANTIWPHIAFQERPTGEHITHIFCGTVGGEFVLYYYRKEGNTSNLSLGELSDCPMLSVSGWDCPYVPDTAQSTVAGVEASKQSGKVALFWTANLPDYTATPGCDTCSYNGSNGASRNAWENDMYYQSSQNYGVTWDPMVNVTLNNNETAAWMPYNDFDALWDTDDKFHIAWTSVNWARFLEEDNPGFGCRVHHWMEDYGTAENGGTARIVMQRLQEPILCNGNFFNLNIGKINLAECNDNFYVTGVDLWDGHDDPLNPDCSQRGYDNDFTGSVNGEIVVAISDDGGFTWGSVFNLTNSPTPECDSAGGPVGPCDADHWPSLTPHGIATLSGDDWSGADLINPREGDVSYPDVVGAEWLDMQFVNDLDPGFELNDNSALRQNPLRHIRVACVPPDQVPVPVYSISEINWPTFVKPGQQKDISVFIENIGNSPTTMNATTEELTGPSGWLTVNDFAASIGEGANNKDTGTVHLDATSISQAKINEAGGTTIVFGNVFFDHDGPSDIDTIPVTLIVTDTILLPNWDTISTGVITLQVATNGQYGGGGETGVTMDYWNDPLECDTVDSIPGNTEYYLYDGSFAVGGVVGSDTVMANQIFNVGPRTKNSIYQDSPQSGVISEGVLQHWSSGKLLNGDSTLAMSVRWVVPTVTMTWGTTAGKTWHADQQFMTREIKVWPNDGLAHNGLAIGDVLDWDIPGDSGTAGNNTGSADGSRRLLYQQGGEYNQDGAVECQDNDDRYGGVAFGFLRAYWDHDANGTTGKKWTIRDSIGYGGYINANARISFPMSASELYADMEAASGYIPWTHGNPDSQKIDLHSVITPTFDYDLSAGDSVAAYTVYASVREDAARQVRISELADKGRNFTLYFTCCIGTRGDLNGDGADANVLDLTFAVDRIFRGGTQAACFGEGDANSDKSVLDVLDLTFLVDRVFRGGPAPNACSSAPL